MAKLNTKAHGTNKTVAAKRTVNRAGGEGFCHSNEETEYITMLMTSFFNEKKFYGDNSEQLKRKMTAIAKKDPEFFVKSLAYARNEMNMRTTPMVGLATAARINESKPFVRQWAPQILKRADEPAEVIAAYRNMFGSKAMVPSCLKKGITGALNNFDAYQMGKYKEKGGLKMVDVFNLVHPKPRADKEELFKMVVDGSLPTPYTWETQTSERGSTREVWEEMIDSGKMGYMALIRNLRNFMEHKVRNIDKALNVIADKQRVARSKQLPFRFLSAHREINGIWGDVFEKDAILQALNQALSYSADNFHLPGRTAVMFDNSGSMASRLSSKSSVMYYDVANTLAAIVMLKGGLGIAFGTTAEQVPLHYTQKMNLLDIPQHIHSEMHVGHSTNAHEAVNFLTRSKTRVDRIIMLSDMQCWNSAGTRYMGDAKETFRNAFKNYRKNYNKDCWMHSIDLAGYGTSIVPDNDGKVNMLAGWSDKTLQFIPMVEQGGDGMVEAIRNYGITPKVVERTAKGRRMY